MSGKQISIDNSGEAERRAESFWHGLGIVASIPLVHPFTAVMCGVRVMDRGFENIERHLGELHRLAKDNLTPEKPPQ